ncbi:Electron transfer DM13 [Phycisphaerae bacterium RAS1]|nr:Electron transfer DM13 [Phycisphaerae bacterium RAS1]
MPGKTADCRRLIVVASCCVLALLGGCPMDAGAGNANDNNANDNAAAGDVAIGQTVELTTRLHNASGTLRVVDARTLQVDNFTFDGGGIDVFVVGSATGDYAGGVKLSADLIRDGGYNNETLTLPLPDGVELADVRHVSIWCQTAGISFADAALN